MKGLLVKDLRLLLGQKKYIAMLLIVSIVVGSSTEGSFFIAYLTFVFSFMVFNTVSSDENDNGYPFLMTLPFERKTYVRGKYVLGMVTILLSWVMGLVIYIAFKMAHGELSTMGNELLSITSIIPGIVFLQSFMLPMHFKFGSERGRVAMGLGLGVIFSVVYLLNHLVNLEGQAAHLFENYAGVAGLVLFAMAAASLVISCGISTVIMKNKEF